MEETETRRRLDEISRAYSRFLPPDLLSILERKSVLVKGKMCPQSVFEVYDPDPPEVRRVKQDTRRSFEEALAFYPYKDLDRAEDLLNQCLTRNTSDRAALVYS